MTTNQKFLGPLTIEDDNLSFAWGRAVRHIASHTGKEICPLIISLNGFDESNLPNENASIRNRLEVLLNDHGNLGIDKVAFTIFPQIYWTIAQQNRHKLFEMYKGAIPRLKKMHAANKHGLYFERLIAFEGAAKGGNQLENIIDLFGRKGSQRMQRQACTYDPTRDQTGTAIQGFPCLQHVTFYETDEGLVLNAFYATQQLFERAYGNFLGLVHLGAFMAHELEMRLGRVNIFVGIEKLEGIRINNPILSEIVHIVNEQRPQEGE